MIHQQPPQRQVQESPNKPSTTSLLKNQEQMINDLKFNFAKEMGELKGQMSEQQQLFKDKLDRLYEE